MMNAKASWAARRPKRSPPFMLPAEEGNRRSRVIRFGNRVSVWLDIVGEAVVVVVVVVVGLVDEYQRIDWGCWTKDR